MKQDTQIANFLLEIKAVKIDVKEPFTWTSGIKSPIYCDCRIVNSHVNARNAVINKFIEIIYKDFLNTDVIAGIASGGISYGALIADRLSKPFVYVREKKKEHGLMKQIEGEYNAYDNVVLIEDLVSTGGSSLNAVKAIRTENLKVAGLLSIMTYGFKEAEDKFKEENVKYESLCDLDTILIVASEKQIINSSDIEKIIQFKKSYKDWNP
jgi:orotate phosphoribosyltransferase